MEIILNTEFLTAQVDHETSLIYLEWFPQSAELSEEAYKVILLQLSNYILNEGIQYWLGDTQNFAFSISPELQKWTRDTCTPRLVKAGLKKMALVIPKEFASNLAVQQTVEEMEMFVNTKVFSTRYFDKLEDAQKWLKEDAPEGLAPKPLT